METKNAKVTAVTLKKQGTGQYGPYFIFTIVFDNGDTGDYLAKSNPQNIFNVGQNADYTKEVMQNGQYTNVKIKSIQQGGFKPQNQGAANRRTALDCAIKYGNEPIDPAILKNADTFLEWLNNETKAQVTKPTPPPLDEVPEWLKD
jgi:hypothetical protein